ncbi:MAG TPA: hypothetical protein O0X23_05525 [Methanocorpusculum sp.]|nr:hypothetical protein [Methanocorpusculum sp.]
MLQWITERFTRYHPDRAIAVRAMRHMHPEERKNLFSEDIMLMRTAEGYWFESLIYEQLLKIASQTNTIKKIVRKGADVPKHKTKITLGTNGLYSAERGDIRIRGNGQDLAEVDLLLFDNENKVIFCEIVTSPADLKDLETEIIYKKHLFGYMFRQEHVGFILFSAVDISNTQVVRRLVANPDNAYVGTETCEVMKAVLKPLRLTTLPTQPVKHPKLVACESLRTRGFDYKKLHDEALLRLYFAIDHHFSVEQYFSDPCVSPLVKKVICGGLYPSALKGLVTEYGLRVKSDVLDYTKLSQNYSKVVLAVDFLEMSPVIYLKPRKQQTYLKMVPLRAGGFRYERSTPSWVGFYLWLESIKQTLGIERTRDVLKLCERSLTHTNL